MKKKKEKKKKEIKAFNLFCLLALRCYLFLYFHVVAFSLGSGGQSPTPVGVAEIVVLGRGEAADFTLIAEG